MKEQVCSAAGCFLEQKGGLLSFPLVTAAGLVDGINPCAISTIVLLLGYLAVFLKQPKRVLPTAAIYIGTIYILYFLFGLFLYNSYDFLQDLPGAGLVSLVLGAFLLLFGAVNIKDYFLPEVGPHIRIPAFIQPKLRKIARKATYPGTFLLAVLVVVFEAPCSLPLYAGTARILYEGGLGTLGVLGYFAYYNFLFVLPLIVIALSFAKGVDYLKIEEATHGKQLKLKLISGIALIGMGVLVLL